MTYDDDSSSTDSFGAEPWSNALGWHSLLWALGTAACASPLFGAVWNPFDSSLFFPMLILSAIVGGLTGPILGQRLQPWLGPSLLFSAVYPMSLALGSAIANLRVGSVAAGGAFGILLLGVLGGALPIAIRLVAPNPSQVLRFGGIVWLALALLLLARVGLGVFGSIESLGYMLASRSAPDEQDL